MFSKVSKEFESNNNRVFSEKLSTGPRTEKQLIQIDNNISCWEKLKKIS